MALIGRRDFLALTAAAFAFPIAVAHAQQLSAARRIAFLSSAVPDDATTWQPLVQGLADYGYVDGKNILLERTIAPDIGALPQYAANIVATKPDLILCVTTPSAIAAKSATNSIPIVFAALNDPVGVGLVMSLAHPGANATGNTQIAPDVAARQLGILKELLPTLRRLAVLSVPADPGQALILAQLRPAAEAASIDLVVLDFDDKLDLDPQLERVAQSDVQAFLVSPIQYLTTKDDVTAAFQLRTGIPRMLAFSTQPFTGVIAYGANLVALRRQTGSYIDAILKGAKPADLPVQEPTVFDLAINLKTAQALALTIPPSLYGQATIVVN